MRSQSNASQLYYGVLKCYISDGEADNFKTLGFPEVDPKMCKSKIFDKGHGTN